MACSSSSSFLIAPYEIKWTDFVFEKYGNHDISHIGDAGLDLFCPETVIIPAGERGFMYKLQIVVVCAEMLTSTGKRGGSSRLEPRPFFLLPRSSMGSKTPLRLSNSVGLIDGGYRGCLCALLDNTSDKPYEIKKGDRLFQICTRNLSGFSVNVVGLGHKLMKKSDENSRGEGGFGSTGK